MSAACKKSVKKMKVMPTSSAITQKFPQRRKGAKRESCRRQPNTLRLCAVAGDQKNQD
jgi:hypothetical protein